MPEVQIATTRPDTIVIRYGIIGTNIRVYRVLEKTSNPYSTSNPCPHSSVHSIQDGSGNSAYYGDIDSLRPSDSIAKLKPGSPERYAAVKEGYGGLKDLCHQIILETCPELAQKEIRYSGGANEVIEESP